MKILEIFENKLRYKNYSFNTIKVYKQTLYQYFKETGCKDPYQISTKEIIVINSYGLWNELILETKNVKNF